MRIRPNRLARFAATALAASLVLTGCGSVVDGSVSFQNASNADLGVKGVDSGNKIDVIAQNSLSDIQAFWKDEFPKVSGGKQLPALKGGLYSVDGAKVFSTESAEGQPVAQEKCAQRSVKFLVNNGAYCRLDDSIVWDRSEQHLFGALRDKYGDFVVAMIFAHEFGHAVQQRLGIFDKRPKTIYTESQADCAAGAWAAGAVDQRAPHFRDVTLAKVDAALEGYLNARDSTPDAVEDVSHGNGFDRLSAVADGYDRGVQYCYSDGYFESRTITSRPYGTAQDQASGGNLPFTEVVDTAADNPLIEDLNRFWTAKAQTIGKKFSPVKIATADRPKCGAASSSSEFGYCKDDNTVYFNKTVAQRVYNSLPELDVSEDQNVTIRTNQPADFSLGTLFSIGWGFAVRHQLFDRDMTGDDALKAAVCYTGAYAKDVNVTNRQGFTLSPADLDESVSALLNEVPQDSVYGAQGTTGLQRVQLFIKGYKGGLSVC